MNRRCAPAWQGWRIAGRSSFADFVANNAADDFAADCSERTAARKNSSSNGTDASADSGVLFLRRRARTRAEAERYCCDKRTKRNPPCSRAAGLLR